MDPLSIAASIAGVATAGVTISIALYDVAHSIKSAPKGVVSLAQELSMLSSILRSLRSTIREHPEVCKKRLVDDTNQILKGVRDVHKDIKAMMLDSTSNFYRLKLVFKSPKTKAIMAKVDSFKSTLNLILGTVQLAVLKKQGNTYAKIYSVEPTCLTLNRKQDPGVASEVAQLRKLLESLMMSNLESVDNLKKSEQKADKLSTDNPFTNLPPPPAYSGDGRPTYIRIMRKYLEEQTLEYYKIRWQIDPVSTLD